MRFQARLIHTYLDETRAERGEEVATVVRRAVAAAVIPNPWLDLSTRHDLQKAVQEVCPPVAITLCSYIVKLLGGADRVAAYGKGAVVGTSGEIEHGSALLHTPFFGNVIRESLDGTSYISFSDSVGAVGTGLTLPLGHKKLDGRRDFFETVVLDIPDAPREDEIIVAIGASDGPRPNARIGDRTTDRKVRLSEFDAHPLAGRTIV